MSLMNCDQRPVYGRNLAPHVKLSKPGRWTRMRRSIFYCRRTTCWYLTAQVCGWSEIDRLFKCCSSWQANRASTFRTGPLHIVAPHADQTWLIWTENIPEPGFQEALARLIYTPAWHRGVPHARLTISGSWAVSWRDLFRRKYNEGK